jgi:hypothetical protein
MVKQAVRGEFVGHTFGTEVGGRHAVTGGQQRTRRGQAHAGVGAGDKRDLVLNRWSHVFRRS